ncbi:MAG: hypothetical protein ACI8Y4_003373 [Candidatus Poriferisodalaceae bacterium]|jgi:hypothetical protein
MTAFGLERAPAQLRPLDQAGLFDGDDLDLQRDHAFFVAGVSNRSRSRQLATGRVGLVGPGFRIATAGELASILPWFGRVSAGHRCGHNR